MAEIDRLRRDGITAAELTKVHAQLRARFVYDADSVTDIAHQLGYFETIASWNAYEKLRERLDAVTPDAVHAAARGISPRPIARSAGSSRSTRAGGGVLTSAPEADRACSPTA